MCGCFALFSNVNLIQRAAKVLNAVSDYIPSFNIAPSHKILTVKDSKGEKVMKQMSWGLIPGWAKDPTIGNKLINARGETLLEKPSFVESARLFRCVIPANGFYEWRKTDKQPMYIYLRNTELFFFAGIYSVWKDPSQNTTDTCSIITIEPNEFIKPIHNRMPLVLMDDHIDIWLNLNNNANEVVKQLSDAVNPSEYLVHPVSKDVNKKSNNNPNLIKPVESDNLFNSN